MWFDTLVLQLRLHMAYRVNGILYRLRFLSLSYESGFAKTLGLVLAILRELLGLLLGKLLYMAAFFAAPLLLFPSEPPAGLYGHLLLFLTLIGGISTASSWTRSRTSITPCFFCGWMPGAMLCRHTGIRC